MMSDMTHAKAVHEARQTLVDLVCMMTDDEWEAARHGAKWRVELFAQANGDLDVSSGAYAGIGYIREARQRYLKARDAADQASSQ